MAGDSGNVVHVVGDSGSLGKMDMKDMTGNLDTMGMKDKMDTTGKKDS